MFRLDLGIRVTTALPGTLGELSAGYANMRKSVIPSAFSRLPTCMASARRQVLVPS
jgi:hypothetical protein